MNNQTILITCVVLCSLGGWYVVLSKYLALRGLLQRKTAAKAESAYKTAGIAPLQPADINGEEVEYVPGEHIPGMGPPPLRNMPYSIPEEVIAAIQRNQAAVRQAPEPQSKQSPKTKQQTATSSKKREVCNWACMLHLSGLAFVTGVPFLNIIFPTMLWLLKKEQHSFLERQGREVINFQITFTFIQFLCLGFGTVFIWLFPNAAAGLFAWTKTARVLFSTSMYLPFNLFTIAPFFWGCIMVIRGSVAAYHGLGFKYPMAQQFIFEGKVLANEFGEPIAVRKEPKLQAEVKQRIGKINFG